MKKLIPIVLFLFASVNVNASHMIGGEITYKEISSLKYEVTLVWYRDCRGIPLNSAGTIRIFCSTGGSATTILPLVSIEDITPICDTIAPRCSPTNTQGTGEGLEKHTYRGIVDFNVSPFSNLANCPGKIIIGGSVNARNGAINTGPSGTLYIEAELDLANAANNSSPVISATAIPYMCCNQPFYYSYSAIDTVDHDSISYSFAPPRSARTTTASYSGNYSYLNPFDAYDPRPNGGVPLPNANPPIGLYLDPVTGELIFTPVNCSEVTVAVIQVTEWRNDSNGIPQIIGKTYRDMQFAVRSCPDNNPPKINGPYTYNACEGETLCFNVNSNDIVFQPPPPTPSPAPDSTKLTWNGAIQDATFTLVSDTARLQVATFCWTPPQGSASNNPYQFMATARDNACPLNGTVNRTFSILVNKKIQGTHSISTISKGVFEAECNIDTTVFSGIPIYGWNLLSDNGNTIIDPNVVTFNSTNTSFSNQNIDSLSLKRNGLFVLSCTIDNYPDNCPVTYLDTIIMDSLLQTLINFPKDTLVCAGTSITLNTTTSYVQGSPHYQWYMNDTNLLVGDTFSTLSIVNIPKVADISYTVKVTDASGEINQDRIRILSRNTTKNLLAPLYEACIGDSIILSIDSSHSNVVWNNTFSSFSQMFFQSSNIRVTYNDTFGCSYKDSAEISFYVTPNQSWSDSLAVCTNNGFELISKPFANYQWNTGDTTSFISIYVDGMFSLYFEDSYGCSNTDSIYISLHNVPVLSVGNDTAFCGDSLLLDAGDFSSYGWSTGSSAKQIKVNSSGNYNVTVVDSNGCSLSDSISVSLFSNPNIPVLTKNGNIIMSSVTGTHRWYRDGFLLNGETSAFLSINRTGAYTAESIDNNGCVSETSNVVVKTVGIKGIKSKALKVYPNPSNGKITIDVTGLGSLKSIKLYDNLGKLIENKQTINGSLVEVEWESIGGIMWVVLETNTGIYHKEVISLE